MKNFSSFRLKIRHILITAICIVTFIVLLSFSESSKEGVLNGLLICGQILIPSLFTFTAAAIFMSTCGAADFIGKLTEPFSKLLFGLNGKAFTVMLLSFISGYPVGAKLTSNLYKNGEVDRETALRMLGFTVNGGPAFIVAAVGEGILGCKSDGWRLLICHLSASVLIAFISGLSVKRKEIKPAVQRKDFPYVSDSFVSAVSDTCSAMLNICCFTLLFSAIISVLSAAVNPDTSATISSFLEVTLGVATVGNRKNLPLIAFFLGFGGLSVQCQVLCFTRKTGLQYTRLFVQRVTHGILSALLAVIAEIVFPRTLDTFSTCSSPAFQLSSGTIMGSAALLLLCIIFFSFAASGKTENFCGIFRRNMIE